MLVTVTPQLITELPKKNSELVALRLLYTVMTVTNFEKILNVICFLRAGHK